MVTFDSGKEQEYYRANKRSPAVYTSKYISETRRNCNDGTSTKPPPVMQDSLSMVSQEEETETAEEMIYYIRHAQEKDLKDASRILTNAFFRFHWFTTPLEWLKTYFSLQDSFLEIEEIRKQRKNQDGSSSEEGKTTNKRIDYRIMVACETKNDAVVGICELDGRPRSLSQLKNNSPRPYICNLAVDKKYRQQGIGKAFVRYCESVARDEWMESYLYLKVRVGNEIAMTMYRKLGYSVMEDNKEESSLSWKSLEQQQGIDAEEQTIVLLGKMLKEP